MYAIIGEDISDAEMLAVLVRRLANDKPLKIKPCGYSGCAELLRKGARQLRLFIDLQYTRFVVCYDADRDDPQARYDAVMKLVVAPTRIGDACCIVVPVQEIEAWILADIEAVAKIFPSWEPAPIAQNPETIDDPKEHLERLSRQNNKKPIYDHSTHNKAVAKHLNLNKVRQRCPSFQPLVNFVLNNESPC